MEKLFRHKHWLVLLNVGLLLSVLGPGCRKEVEYQANGNSSPAKDKTAAKRMSFCYIIEGTPEQARAGVAIDKVSVATPYTAVLKLQELTLGKKYAVEWKGIDGAGISVYSTKQPETFVATDTNWWAWYYVVPNLKDHKPGKWKWTANVSDLGNFSTDLIVLPATPGELENFARYEKARENSLRAFAEFWLGINGTFHTVISYKRHRNQASPETVSPSLAQLAQKEFQGDRPAIVSPTERSPESDEFNGYLQVAGVDWTPSQNFISEADRLNGITWKEIMTFRFRVFRFYRANGWAEWVDSHEYQNNFDEFFGRHFAATPEELGKRLRLRFSVVERDGNWFVKTSSGDEFVNGKLVKEVSDWKNEKPEPGYAKDLIDGAKSFTRESYREMGSASRLDPAALEQNTISTMDMLRGKPLIP